MKNETTNAILDLLEFLFLGSFYLIALIILFGMHFGDAVKGIIGAICFTLVFSIIVHYLQKNK